MPFSQPDRLLWILPILYAMAAAGAIFARSRASAWRCAEGLSLIAAIGVLSLGITQAALSAFGTPAGDATGSVMAVLIGLLGWIIVRYSRTYLSGESGQKAYVAALMLVLTAVAMIVLSRNLAVILLAWSASSLALHKLLTFYPERAGAMLAAHKKFIVSRLAELCIAGALILLYLKGHSLSLASINTLTVTQNNHGWLVQGAMLLVVSAVVLKAAQLPFHGWLIQVMEAPTPVSALLHAGVVNIGGFILIRLAPLLTHSEAARALLVIAGTATATLAGMAMMTRIDIKTRLAWSTCAQMGFMLLECGLGLFTLAFLHLVAHSLYKAYGFLSSGQTVRRTTQTTLQRQAPGFSRGLRFALELLSAPLAIAVSFILAHFSDVLLPELHPPRVALVIAGLATAPLFWCNERLRPQSLLRGVGSGAAIVLLYLAWHLVFSRLNGVFTSPVSPIADGFVAASFSLMYALQIVVRIFPDQRAIKSLHAWAYAGFYLDEVFSRLTQRIWPLKRTLRTTSALAWGIGKRVAGGYE